MMGFVDAILRTFYQSNWTFFVEKYDLKLFFEAEYLYMPSSTSEVDL